MPKCKYCGNSKLFGSSQVPPAAPYANGIISGVVGEFSGSSELTSLTRIGATKATTNAAAANPRQYFDVCLECGSNDVEWE